MISYIIKRDGRRESFDLDKIANAVFRAAQSVGGTDAAMARDVAEKPVRCMNSCTAVKNRP